MPSDHPLLRVQDILENIARIERFTAGLHLHSFSHDEKAQFACLHALLIISEAARKLGDHATELAPGQPWAAIRSMGNILRHEYDDVDPEIIWHVISNGDLALLKQAMLEAVDVLRR